MFAINIHKEYERLQYFAGEVQVRVSGPEAKLYAGAPRVSGWTTAQQIQHATMVNNQIFGQLVALCEGDTLPEEGKISMVGRLVLALGRFPRGRSRSPQSFVPAERPDREQLAVLVEEMGANAQALEAYLDRIPTLRGRFRHPVFGYLNAPQWLRFARIHALHHLAIIRDIEGACAKVTAEKVTVP